MGLENLPEIEKPYGHYKHNFRPIEKVEITMKDRKRYLGYAYGKDNGQLLLASSIDKNGIITNRLHGLPILINQIKGYKVSH